MNNYILFDGKRYKTIAKSWKPSPVIPGTGRLNLNGELDVTFGSGITYHWGGTIIADVNPPEVIYGEDPWGTPDDLRATLAKRSTLVFQDHQYPDHPAYEVAVFRWSEASLTPMWDGLENSINFTVDLMGVVP